MTIDDIYVRMLVHFRQSSFEGLHLSYRWHAMLANMYEFRVFISTEYSTRLLNLIFSTIMLPKYLYQLVHSFLFILEFQKTFHKMYLNTYFYNRLFGMNIFLNIFWYICFYNIFKL